MNKTQINVKKLTIVALFCALAFVCTATIKVPVMFLTLDIKDSVIVLCSLILGPLSALAVAIIVPLLELTYSATGLYGLIMNILSSVTFSLVTGLIYKYKKTFYGAVVGLLSGVASVLSVMLLANLFITPYYMGVSTSEVAALIPTVLLPFNLVKATLNAGIVLLLYKPLSKVLKRTRLIESKEDTGLDTKGAGVAMRSGIVSVVALIIIALSLAVVFFVLK